MLTGINSITFIAAIVIDAQQKKEFETSFSIEKGSVFIHIKKGDEQLLNVVEPVAYFENLEQASKLSSLIFKTMEDNK